MYKVTIGRGTNALTKYFTRWHEAKQFCKGLGWTTRKIKVVC